MFVLFIKNVICICLWISVFRCAIIRVNSLRSRNLKGIFIFKNSVSYRSQLLQPSTRNPCFVHNSDYGLSNNKAHVLNKSSGLKALGLFEGYEEKIHDREYNFPLYEKKWQRFWEDTKLFQTHDPGVLKIDDDNDCQNYDEKPDFQEKNSDSNNGFLNAWNGSQYLTHSEDSVGNQSALEDAQEVSCNVSTLDPGRSHLERTVCQSNYTTSNNFPSEERSVVSDSDHDDNSESVSSKPKYYILSMIPYPSGKGLHVGHLLGYTVVDVIARYKRFNNFNVLNPIGFDCFGIPTEIYSEKVNKSPEEVTKENVSNFRNQLKSMGFSFDFTRELLTCDPSYYKWTQWIFQQMFLRGLAYQDKDYVNYCPGLGCELSNEEVKNGKSTRGDFDVFKRLKTMWKLRITEYAKRLYDDLQYVEYPEKLVNLQKNWINPKKGYIVKFSVYDPGDNLDSTGVYSSNQHNQQQPYNLMKYRKPYRYKEEDVFIDGLHLYGFVDDLKKCEKIESLELPVLLENIMEYCSLDKREEVKAMLDESLKMSNVELSMEKNRKRIFSGLCAINPYNKGRMPIYVTNALVNTNKDINCKINVFEDELGSEGVSNSSILSSFSFDSIFGNATGTSSTTCNTDSSNNEYQTTSSVTSSNESKNEMNNLSPDSLDGSADWFREYLSFNIKDWVFSRNRGWGEPIPVSSRNTSGEDIYLNENRDEVERNNEGKEKENQKVLSKEEKQEMLKELPLILDRNITETMPQWAGSCWHYLRFVDPKNSEEAFSRKLASYWLPVDLYVGGVEHAVSHLLYSRFWNKFLYDIKVSPVNEPYRKILLHGVIKTIRYYISKSDYEKLDFESKWKICQYNNYNNSSTSSNTTSTTISNCNDNVGNEYSNSDSCNSDSSNSNYSSYYDYNHDDNGYQQVYCGPFDPSNLNDDFYGLNNSELPDIFVDKEEVEVPPDIVMKYKNKYVISKDKSIELKIRMKKMSKSRGNVINPEEVTKMYGSDALRLHLMFLGPVDKDKIWSIESIKGVYRLLMSVNKFYVDYLKYSRYNHNLTNGNNNYSSSSTNTTSNSTIDSVGGTSSVTSNTSGSISSSSSNDYNNVDPDIAIEVNRFIDNVTNNMENIKLNKVSEFFDFFRMMQKWHQQRRLTFRVLDVFLIMFNPYAPHLTEHLWYLKYLHNRDLHTNGTVSGSSERVPNSHQPKLEDEVDKDYKSISLESWPTKFNVT